MRRRHVPFWLRIEAVGAYDAAAIQAAYTSGDADALEVAARPLIAKVARFYVRNGLVLLDAEDLMQAGFIGLRKAVANFDGRDSVQFASFATWWVRSMVQRLYIRDNWRNCRLPRQPVPDPAWRICHAGDYATPAGDADDRALEPAAKYRRDEDPAAAASDADDRRHVLELMRVLSHRDARVLALRIGLDGVELTFGEIAATMSIEGTPMSRERARQICDRALSRVAVEIGVVRPTIVKWKPSHRCAAAS